MEERAAAIAGSEQGVQAAGAQKAELPGGFQGEGGDCGEGDRLWILFRLVGGEVTGRILKWVAISFFKGSSRPRD